MKIQLKEHQVHSVDSEDEDFSVIRDCEPRVLDTSNGRKVCAFRKKYKKNVVELQADYYAGIDWIVPEKKFIHVEPKVNAKLIQLFEEKVDDEREERISDEQIKNDLKSSVASEIDLFQMLLDIYDGTIPSAEIKPLIYIYCDDQSIPIEQVQDQLSPFLISQFLLTVKRIVQKGLKKGYYTVEDNLESKVRGRILVGQQLRKNVFKGNLTKTVCSYQEFGVNTVENRFLKHVLQFCSSYLANHTVFRDTDALRHLIQFSNPAFEMVGKFTNLRDLQKVKNNPFYKDYKQAILLGEQILKRFDFQISNAASEQKTTPPYWIDMPLLFELYVYRQLLKDNPTLKGKIFYQESTYGNILDFLVQGVRDEQNNEWKVKPLIIDAKYKLHYKSGHIHSDIRQVSGYARLKKIRERARVVGDEHIPCLIVYPTVKGGKSLNLEEVLDVNNDNTIKCYHEVYKVGIGVPLKYINSST